MCPQKKVASSIHYLEEAVAGVRTPYSLSWALIGLAVWSVRPVEYRKWLAESLNLQGRYGEYDTDLLALLIIAGRSGKEVDGLFALPRG
jgi:hypothetical protein